MPLDASWPLQQAVYGRLTGDMALMARLNGVYDHVSPEAAYPYATLGPATVRDWSSKSFSGEEHRFDVHLWSAAPGHGEAKELMALAYDALHEAALTLPGHALVSLRFEFGQILREAAGPLHHAIMRFRALTHALP
ncbi:MAG: DUF3168 domain-containing protein [Pseudomonadota bacterium]